MNWLKEIEANVMKPTVIEAETVAAAIRKAIEAVREDSVEVKRTVGGWCMMKPGQHVFHEIYNATIRITSPLKRWNSRVNSGMLTETIDYLLALNPGYTHKSRWDFYEKFFEADKKKYPYTYGQRVFGKKGEIDQWAAVIKSFSKDSTTRHGHVTLYRPDDLLRDFVPCNFAWHFQIDDTERLNMITFCRSQDALRGLFLDCFAYTHFLEQMALATNLTVGTYTVFETNLHIYDKDFDKIDTAFAKPVEPYSAGIYPKGASLLTRKDKNTMHEILRQVFDGKTFPDINSIDLPSYWKDWMIFIATETMKRKRLDFNHIFSKIENAEILWTLKKILAKKSKSFSVCRTERNLDHE